jgi:4-hydroxy-L-threonine phosphate dehydrogenase PdxA
MTPPIGITMGDPAGVGPEIIVKSLAAMHADARQGIRVYGNRESLAAAEAVLRTGLDLAALDVVHVDIPGRASRLRQAGPALRRGELPVHRGRCPRRAGGRDRLHRHRADQQGRAERGGSSP